MKVLLILAALVSTSAFAGFPLNTDYTTGDKILFQRDSAWISIFNKSLCRNGGQFEAVIKKCMKYSNPEESNCTQEEAVFVTQPVNSTVAKCVAYTGREKSNCVKWVAAPFVQSPVMNVNYYNSHDQLLRTDVMTVPACSASK